MTRRALVVMLLALVASLASPIAGAQRVTTSSSYTVVEADVSEALRKAVRTGVLANLRSPRFPGYRDELTTLYTEREWRPIWIAVGRPTPAARAALDLLRSAGDRGLHPEDYDAAPLERRFGQLASGATPTAQDVAWFDLALSVGLLRHVSDVHVGRVDPRTLSIGINVQPKKLELARLVRDAIDGGRVSSIVKDAEPRFAQYRSLLRAYARYRLLADSSLPTVTADRPLRPGEPFAGVGALRSRLVAFGDLSAANAGRMLDSTRYDAVTAGAVAHFQERHGLPADSVLGRTTIAAINVPPATRAQQLELALERIRWLPSLDEGPFIVVNVPSFTLYGFDKIGGDGAPALTMNVVVGKAEVGRATPLFEDGMQYIIFRPYWVIPPGILRRETLPAVRRDPGYLARNDMEVFSGDGDTGTPLPATAANLARVASGTLGVRQRPGPRNSLGLAKFIFPNDHNVYLHSTPATELFSRARRDFSHGCIRVEDPAGLAVWVLRDPTAWSRTLVETAMNGDRSRRVNLTRPLPVLIYYTTAVVRPDGVVAFYDDVYGHDARLEKALVSRSQ